ncbi:MAG: N-acetylmuramic acid 6-phosphate etherase [Lachnospiraceae bacterium]|nr:N-acetylmuramic acid 6-phosphate etherase [Lachnospiraceae bacterium]
MGDCYSGMETEKLNPLTQNIDLCSVQEIVTMINREDAKVADAVKEAIPQISEAVERIYKALKGGGHLLYMGAGTSGRLGVLDASECMPTFGVEKDLVQGCIAGGDVALRFPIEGCEDDAELGKKQIEIFEIGEKDVVVGISASGRAPFVIGAMERAREVGAQTVAVVNNPESKIKEYVDVCIEAVTGPEVISGSTRMKAGTAQKMILNMLSTATMIKLGKVYGNLMVDLKASNKKLEDRAERIFCKATGKSREVANRYLKDSGMNSKVAILMCLSDLNRKEAEDMLEQSDGFLRVALGKTKEV